MPSPLSKSIVHTDRAPAAVGAYSQAVRAGSLVFVSGQIALDPQTGELSGDTAARQARQALTNLAEILKAAGTSLDRVVKCTVMLDSIDDFAAVNAVYAEFFPSDPPARAAYAVAKLPRGALVEIDAIALEQGPFTSPV
jgi:2-iminobutanoate/2-iminopropanoate deaminase